MRGDAASPTFESARRIEAGVSAMDAPERFDGQIFGRGGVAYDAQDPTVNGALMLAEHGLEGVDVALAES